MSHFTDAERSYFRSQRLGRLATVGPDGKPHVVPVGFRYDADADAIDIGGHGLDRSKKWRDLVANPSVAFVIDDLASVDPWTPRGVEIRGTAEMHEAGGERIGPGFGPAWLRIRAERIVAWGIDGDAFSAPAGRRRSRNARTLP
jgi:pyridoxamine 5'-phosphate oxidase family protein